MSRPTAGAARSCALIGGHRQCRRGGGALSDTGKVLAVDVQSVAGATDVPETDEDDENDTTASGSTEHLTRPRCAIRCAPGDRRLVRIFSYDVDFPAPRRAPGDSSKCCTRATTMHTPRKCLYAALTVAGAKPRNSTLSSPDEQRRRLLRRGAGRARRSFWCASRVGSRHHELGLLVSAASKSSAFPDAHRCRLGGALRHADLGLRQWHDRMAGWESGYGKYIKVKHSNGYEPPMATFVGLRRRASSRASASRAGPGDRVRSAPNRRVDRPRYSTTRSWSTAASSVRPMRIRLPRAPRARRPDPGRLREGADRVEAWIRQAPGRGKVGADPREIEGAAAGRGCGEIVADCPPFLEQPASERSQRQPGPASRAR